jgi:hypothetical protein
VQTALGGLKTFCTSLELSVEVREETLALRPLVELGLPREAPLSQVLATFITRRQSPDHGEPRAGQACLGRHSRFELLQVLARLEHQYIAGDICLGAAAGGRYPTANADEL